MHITIFATGKCREKSMLALEAEYLKRMPANWKVKVVELTDATTPEAESAIQTEALESLPKPCFKMLLDETGSQTNSRGFAAKIGSLQENGTKSLAILIGGANGFHSSVRSQAHWLCSFGQLTMPHQLVRVVLAEQLYRAHTILSKHPYHRD